MRAEVMLALMNISPGIEDLMLLDVLSSPYPYEQGMVKAIIEGGKQLTLVNAAEAREHYQHGCIKIEGMEKLNQKVWDFCQLIRSDTGKNQPFSCHVFIANEKAHSFPDHTDPDGVFLYVVEGEKTIVLNDTDEITLKKRGSTFIPAGTVHRAINRKASVMLSIGFDKFISEKL
jgi:quercetin dioxygenase-like cupin family protein